VSAAALFVAAPWPGAGPPRASAARNADAPPLVIAHRGASAAAPEHTVAAYDRAVADGADVLECDLQMTADDVLVCVHDTTVDRTTGGARTGRVDAFTLAELRGIDFGSWFGPEFAGARVVTFEEQLRCYGAVEPPVQFYAETKTPAEYGGRMEPQLVALLERLELLPEGAPGDADARRAPVIVQSFDLESLEAVKRLAPAVPTAWLWAAPPAGTASGEVPDSVDVVAPIAAAVRADPGIVRAAHRAGREVHTWTVDDAAEIDALLDAGVDGIFSNRPGVLRERVDARAARPSRRHVTFERGCAGDGGDSGRAASRGAGGGASRGAGGGGGGGRWLLAAVVVPVVVAGAFGWWSRARRARS
jgi:glycerophosphoryl diester phosphodiesterase